RVGPLVEARQHAPAYLVVVADRRGAEIFGMTAGGRELAREVEGSDDPLTKSKPGGWSQPRYQERAENTWEHNAENVVDVLTRLAKAVDPRVILLGGDVRAVALIRESLPKPLAPRVRAIEGTRAAGGDDDETAAEIATIVASVVA